MIFHALLGIPLHQTMVMEDNCDNNNGMASGWPLGLGNMNMMRLIVSTGQPHSSTQRRPLLSFSSFSSSSLDTQQSTASFFQDRSVSLGRLMGIKPAENRGRFFNTNSTCFDQKDVVPHSRSYGKGSSKRHCVPLLHNVIGKMTRSRAP
ncbi:hypothetical protein Leryth_011008 [Lithospermum erythrorhizon]|nr:hypothetical protein Leryth_011008 [Lithospermum erythrorhizon]